MGKNKSSIQEYKDQIFNRIIERAEDTSLGVDSASEQPIKGDWLRVTVSLSPFCSVGQQSTPDEYGERPLMSYQDCNPDTQRNILHYAIENGVRKFVAAHFDQEDFMYLQKINKNERAVFRYELTKEGHVHAHGYLRYPATKQYKTNCQRLAACIWKYIPDHKSNIRNIAVKVLNGFVDTDGEGLCKWIGYISKDKDEIDLDPTVVEILTPVKFKEI